MFFGGRDEVVDLVIVCWLKVGFPPVCVGGGGITGGRDLSVPKSNQLHFDICWHFLFISGIIPIYSSKWSMNFLKS